MNRQLPNSNSLLLAGKDFPRSLVSHLIDHIQFFRVIFFYFSKKKMLSPSKKFAQDNDVAVPNPPADGISSISLNGNLNMHPTLLVATSWDNTVKFYWKISCALSFIFFI